MIREVPMFKVVCDECGLVMEDEEFGGDLLFETRREALGTVVDSSSWSTDGEGHFRCWNHDRLQLTQAGADEIARRPGPYDVPLLGLGLTR